VNAERTGASEGDFASATSQDFTSDAVAALVFLRRQPTVAPARVGLAGHSEGGLIDRVDRRADQRPWFRLFLHHDPRIARERVRVPVLSLIGEKDLQVPDDLNSPEIRAAFERGGRP